MLKLNIQVAHLCWLALELIGNVWWAILLLHLCIIYWLASAEWWGSQDAWLRKKTRLGRKKSKEKERERATWTPSVSAKVNISDIPPGTLVYRGQRS